MRAAKVPTGLAPVLVLRTAILTFDDEAGRQVGDAYRRIGFLNVLTACARRAEGVDADVRRVDVDFFEFVSLRHHRDGTGRVWMRPCDSVSGTRWTRCAPDSNLSRE